MQAVLRPEAEQELLEAQAWYESKAWGLDLSSPALLTRPLNLRFVILMGICSLKNVFIGCYFVNFLTRSFIRQAQNELLVVSFFHQHREPGSWLEWSGS